MARTHHMKIARTIGRGRTAIVLHGGPDFDHRYLLPELDRLADRFRLVYYDQRGRGAADDDVEPDDVTLASELDDLDAIRHQAGVEAAVLLAHSWGAVLALEYAVRNPTRVSHLALVNPAPIAHADVEMMRAHRPADEVAGKAAIAATDAFARREPEALAAYYRVHFRRAAWRANDTERVVARIAAGFTRDGMRKAMAIEQRLYADTWASPDYDLAPRLATLAIPTVVVYGEHDFIPAACIARIARAIPNAQLVEIPECGHFCYLERPEELRSAIIGFSA